MTNEEALGWLSQAKGNVDALQKAKEALRLQIPAKPNLYYGLWKCPNCLQSVSSAFLIKRCPNCTQLIDWSILDDLKGKPKKENENDERN